MVVEVQRCQLVRLLSPQPKVDSRRRVSAGQMAVDCFDDRRSFVPQSADSVAQKEHGGLESAQRVRVAVLSLELISFPERFLRRCCFGGVRSARAAAAVTMHGELKIVELAMIGPSWSDSTGARHGDGQAAGRHVRPCRA